VSTSITDYRLDNHKRKKLKKINLGTIECPQYVNINATLFEDSTFALINCKIEF